MEKGRNVKAGALEVILAGNPSYHGDLVKAMQQIRSKRGKQKAKAEVSVSASVSQTSLLIIAEDFLTVCVYIVYVNDQGNLLSAPVSSSLLRVSV